MGDRNENSIAKVLEEYEKELSEGLRERKLTIDDIEKMLGQRLSDIRDALMTKTGEIMARESKDDAECCEECGKTLKKTKKEGSH